METLKFLASALLAVAISVTIPQTHGLTIDNQLVIIANDCYTRIAIGSTLPSKDISASVIAVTVTECEDECSRKRSTCEIFSFGISSKGNASCLLGTGVPNAEDLVPNSDYDIYVRQQSSPHCMPDRLYKLGSGQRNPTANIKGNDGEREDSVEEEKGRKPKPGKRPINQNIIPGPGGFGTILINRPSSEDRLVPIHSGKPTDGNHENRPNYSGYQVTENIPNFSHGYGRPGEGVDPDNPNGPYSYGNKNYGSQGSQDFYAVEHEIIPNENSDDYYLHNYDQGDRYGTNFYETPATVACYRKLFAGKRLAEIHIRRAVDCERIEECSRECDSEKGFACEGFNYRHPGSRGSPPRGRGHGTCELTSMPPSRIDVVRDIIHEPRYDYYERELGCDNKRPSRPSRPSHPPRPPRPPRPEPRPQSGWHNVRPLSPPQEERPYFHQRPIEIPRPLLPDRRPMIDIPRPMDHDYLPKRPFHEDNWRPEPHPPRRIPQITIRPIEDDVRYEDFRPGRPYLSRPNYWQHRPQHNHDFGTNEIEHYQPGRRKDSIPGYGGVYGGSYGYNTNYIDGNYDVPNRGTFLNHDKRPFDNAPGNGIYGDVYNYGGAFGYGDNYSPADRDVVYGGSGHPGVCSVRSGAGFKLRRGIVRKSYLTPSLDHCENLCAIEKDCVCMTFSYRYTVAANAPTDNCLLSEVSYRDLDFYNDLEPDRDYDIYSMTGDQKSCGKERPANERPPEECFWRVRSGCGVPPEVVRKTIVAQGLGDCEAECVESREFTCRSFVYRYGEAKPSNDESPNCFLSDWPSQEIDPLSLPEVDGAELYQRGSFGRGCEPHPFPPLNHHMKRPGPSESDNRPAKKDEVCYAEYQKPCKLTPEAVITTIYVHSEFECRERCSEMRERDPVPCMSFSYRLSNDRKDHNCYMSDVPHRDLRPGIDYVLGDGHLLFAWKEFEPHCDSGYSIGIFIDKDRDSGPKRPTGYDDRPDPGPGPYIPQFEDQPGPGRPHGSRPYPPQPDFGDHRPGERPYGHGGQGYGPNSRPSYHPHNPDRPDPEGPNYGPGGDKGMIDPNGFYGGSEAGGSFPDTDGRFGHGYSDDRYNDFSHKHAGSTFQHFTVNGHPCKRGTRCERNKIAGFWSCEPEGGEYGSWDYCCEPKHHCGYSQGYHYPWCYVGPYEDQWRPCSEQYYPHTPSRRPVRPSGDRWDENPYGEIPRPGMLGRHWPVAYLHREAPPNATDHFGGADGRRKDRELQGNGGKVDCESQKDSKQSTGKIARIVRLDSEFGAGNSPAKLRRTSSDFNTGRNSSRLTESRRDRDSEILKLADFVDRRDADALETRKNDTDSGNSQGTTFVRLPTITPNKTGEIDYFEIVNVQ